MNLNENYTGKTKLKDWWIIVRDNFKAIATRFNSHTTAAELDHPSGSVKKKHMDTNSVGTSQVESKAITEDKIALSAVTTDKVKDGNVTRAKLHSDVQSELDSFKEHINNPSQEIADGAVTMDKLNEEVKSEIGKINDAYLVTDPIDLESKGLNYDENLGEAYLSNYAPNSNALYIIKDAKGSAGYINDPDGVVFECVTLAGGNPAIETGDTAIIKFVYPDSEGEFGKFYILSRTSKGGSSIAVDSELSDTSENPVQNKVIKAELDKKYEIPNENADYLLQYTGSDSSGNGTQINTDLFVPYFYAGNEGGYVALENVSVLEFTDSNGFKNIDEITQAIVSLQERVSALEG